MPRIRPPWFSRTARYRYGNLGLSSRCIFGEPVCPAKAGMSSGRQSHRGKNQGPVAWVAFAEETKRMKPTDKAALGAVSESPGRNESEPTGGLDTNRPKVEPFGSGRRQHGIPQDDRRGMSLRRGGRDSTVARTCRATGETVFVPSGNRGSARWYNRRNREVDRRRNGGGQARNS